MFRKSYIITLLVILSHVSFSQFNYLFSEDSLVGINYENLGDIINGKNHPQEIIDEITFSFKRNFINKKYNLIAQKNQNVIRNEIQVNRNTAISSCDNEDFELSIQSPITSSNQVQGWTFTNGSLNYAPGINCTVTSNSFSDTTLCSIINGTNYIDPVISNTYSINSVFGNNINGGFSPNIGQMYGNSFLKLGNNNSLDLSFHQATKKILVTNNNCNFRYAYIFVGSGGHDCCNGPILRVEFTNITTNSVLPVISTKVGLFNPNVCTSTNTIYYAAVLGTTVAANYTGQVFTKWKVESIDLSPFLGDSIKVDFITSDCYAAGHFGYAYIDAQCLPVGIFANNVLNTTGTYSACNTVTLSGPNSFSYLWNGPPNSGISNFTTQVVTPTVSGIYSLTLSSGTLILPTNTINLTIMNPSTLIVTASHYSICIGGMSNLQANSSGAVTYSWSQGSNFPSVLVSPTTTTVYSVTVMNSHGCYTTGIVGINVFNCTSIRESAVDNETFEVFPNPNNGTFIIKSQAKSIIELYNSIGQLISKNFLDEKNNFEVLIKDLSKGIYFVKSDKNNFKMLIVN